MNVLVVDHADSFVFILADQFARLGATTAVYRVPATCAELADLVARERPDLVVLSPGPGHPDEATATVDWLRSHPSVPVLGVCLGHQCMAVAAGGRVERAGEPVHGRASKVELLPDPLHDGLPEIASVARYHSLVVTKLPETLRVIARTIDDGLVMAMRHEELPWVGLQFHPESVLTPRGGPWIERVLAEAASRSEANR